jgi:hypothetical protein
MQFTDACRHDALADAKPFGNDHSLRGDLADANFSVLKL